MHQKTNTSYLLSSLAIFRQYQKMGIDTMAQLTSEELHWKPEPESNSIYIIVKHLHGNMRSRWTDIFNSDGEKPDRNRDTEFEEESLAKEDILRLYNKGWDYLFDALTPLSDDDMVRIVFIRGEAHSLLEAINRQIAHYAYHIGQIIYIAKAIKGEHWHSLSIAKNKSREFNKKMFNQ